MCSSHFSAMAGPKNRSMHPHDIDTLLIGDSRLRLQTAVRLRWFGVVGQLLTVLFVAYGLRFELPIGPCLSLIAASAWLNVFLRRRYTARYRLTPRMAMLLLAYDIVQLGGLLFMTGGIENPFAFLIVAPVTVSAATQPPRATVMLGILAGVISVVLTVEHWPMPWYAPGGLVLPQLYKWAMLGSIAACTVFLALYVWRLSKESRQMSAALAATETVLAREQKLHALDGLAAAAAHELGTPLATITLVAKELGREVPKGSPIAEDLALLQSQAVRCREILQKLTQSPGERDPLHAELTVTQLVQEAAAPYRAYKSKLNISCAAVVNGDGGTQPGEPVGERRPGVIYGLGNLIENAVDFARERVDVAARWTANDLIITITDDGPGFLPDVMDSLGDPYITTRPGQAATLREKGAASGLGLGFFIAKTLLERSGARLTLSNRTAPERGAMVTISWPRESFEAETIGFLQRRATDQSTHASLAGTSRVS
jgi:two-component system, sensor histidine kinase RegB